MLITFKAYREVHRVSLYWKESMKVETKAFSSPSSSSSSCSSSNLQFGIDPETATVDDVMAKCMERLGLAMEKEEEQLRLEGFTLPFHEVIFKGRSLIGKNTLASYGLDASSAAFPFVFIKR